MHYSEKTIYLSTKVLFGKYKGKNLYELIRLDIVYVDWLLNTPYKENPKDPKVTKMFNEFWERKNERLYGFRNDSFK